MQILDKKRYNSGVKTKYLVFAILALLLVGGGLWLKKEKANNFSPIVPSEQFSDQPDELSQEQEKDKNTEGEEDGDEKIHEAGDNVFTNTPTSLSTAPLPTEEDIIRLFFNLIDEGRIPEAIEMMSASMAPDDSSKQAWGVHFNAINSIQVSEIKPYNQKSWDESKHKYEVLLNVDISEDSANAPIPYYGWATGLNSRWIILEKDESDMWKIASISTGP